MKRFFIISLFMAVAVEALPCISEVTHNWYLFYACDKDEFHYRADEVSRENWKAYLGLTGDENYYFDADELIKAARMKADLLMVSYVQQLQRYLDCCEIRQREQYEWNYPTEEERTQMRKTVREVREYAQSKLSTRLRSQHALLFMRCNMLLGNHGENVNFWEQTASKYIESIYKEMMLNIYAGALLKTGRGDRAGQIFAEQGDYRSLMTQFYKKRSYQAIRQEYLRDPQSAVLPFLLQDFVNNAQEAADGDGYGKLFVRDIQRQEAEQMIALCEQAVSEEKTQHPVMWQTAKAWLEFLFDKRQLALADIQKALNMTDNQYHVGTARIINLYISAMLNPYTPQFEEFLAGELRWLDQEKRINAKDRTVQNALAPKLKEIGRYNTVLLLLNDAGDYGYSYMLDTMSVDHLLAYVDYMNAAPKTPIDAYLKERAKRMETDEYGLMRREEGPHVNLSQSAAIIDLVGTKYLRLCQWDKALEWLKKVPVSYYEKKGYAVYAEHRSYTVEPWIKRQWLKSDMEWSNDEHHLQSNPKADFAQEMLRMEKELKKLRGRERQHRCYDLAVRYAQACNIGDCWFLTHDGKSVDEKYYYFDEEANANEADYPARCRELLLEASTTTDFQLREKALFALSYIYLNKEPWYSEAWNTTHHVSVKVAEPAAEQYRAFATLMKFEQENPGGISDYVSRCDEYQTFVKFLKRQGGS